MTDVLSVNCAVGLNLRDSKKIARLLEESEKPVLYVVVPVPIFREPAARYSYFTAWFSSLGVH
jgi:hypothetical protein